MYALLFMMCDGGGGEGINSRRYYIIALISYHWWIAFLSFP